MQPWTPLLTKEVEPELPDSSNHEFFSYLATLAWNSDTLVISRGDGIYGVARHGEHATRFHIPSVGKRILLPTALRSGSFVLADVTRLLVLSPSGEILGGSDLEPCEDGKLPQQVAELPDGSIAYAGTFIGTLDVSRYASQMPAHSPP
ncbi:MAG TPA: hypothetical protein VFH51_17725 [Myxococcota bacterium]|nr:hypothetical protein [Myxococcota bacterium]